MRIAWLVGLWAFSLAALASAGLTALVALANHHWLWIGVVVGVAFATITNPLTSPLLGFKGRIKRTLITQAALVCVGVGSIAMQFYVQGEENRRIAAEMERKKSLEANAMVTAGVSLGRNRFRCRRAEGASRCAA